MTRFGFPKEARLRCERDFKRVYSPGAARVRAHPLRACALRRTDGQSRLGLSVGRKVGSATVRNRWKRAVREAFRLNRHRFRAAYDVVISVSWDASPDEVRHVGAAFLKIVEGLNAAEEGGRGRP